MDLLQSDDLAGLATLQPLTPVSIPTSPAYSTFSSTADSNTLTGDDVRQVSTGRKSLALEVSSVQSPLESPRSRSPAIQSLERKSLELQVPVLQKQVMNSKSLKSSGSTTLPVHIWKHIANYLSVRDLSKLCQVNKFFQKIVYNDSLWMWRLAAIKVEQRVEKQPQSNQLLITSDINPLNVFDHFTYPKNDPRTGVIKLFRVLGNYYYSIVSRPTVHFEPVLFEAYRDPVQQAKLLSQLVCFSGIDPLEDNHEENINKLISTIEIFQTTKLTEFDQAIKDNDLKCARDCSSVLVITGVGDSCVNRFIDNCIANFKDFFEPSTVYYLEKDRKFDMSSFQNKLSSLVATLNDISKTVDQVFTPDVPVLLPLFEKILEQIVMEFITSLMETLYEESTSLYLKTVPAIYSLFIDMCNNLQPCNNAGPDYIRRTKTAINDHFNSLISSYLNEELEVFSENAERQVISWTQDLRSEEQATESFLWSNVSTKVQDKKDFLTSFKKVLFMPVSVMGTSRDSVREKHQLSSSSSSLPSTSSNLKSQSPGQFDSIASSSTTSLNSISSNPTASRSVSRAGINGRSGTPPPSTVPPNTQLEAMIAVMNNKLEGIKTLFSLELAISLIAEAKNSTERMQYFVTGSGELSKLAKDKCECLFVELVNTLGGKHIKGGFDMAIERLNTYDPRQHRKIVSKEEESGQERNAVEPLAIFAELVNIGDLIQQMIHTFFEEELATRKLVNRDDFLAPSVKAKKRFEQILDESVANGLNRGIDVLIDQVDFTFITLQLGSDYCPLPANIAGDFDISPTNAAKKVVSLLSSHMWLLEGSTERSIIEVFQQEVSLRFFHSICKHLKRQIISIDGAIKLICDVNYYYDFIASLRQRQLLPYFAALKEIGQLFLIDARDAKALGQTLSDMSRFRGIFKPEEILEFVQRRQDWLLVKRDVEKVIYGIGVDCIVM